MISDFHASILRNEKVAFQYLSFLLSKPDFECTVGFDGTHKKVYG